MKCCLECIGLIPDGNRRWAREQGLKPWKGHERGAEVMKDFLEWARDNRIRKAIIYGLSEDNLKRSRQELSQLFRIYRQRLKKFLKDKQIHENSVKIQVISTKPRALPQSLRSVIKEIEEATKDYARYCVKILLAWSAQHEFSIILRKSYKLAKKGLKLSKLEDMLLVSEQPDLLIRTGHEHRISDFLSVQLRYSEIYLLDKYFPDCMRKDWDEALQWYSRRERRHGR